MPSNRFLCWHRVFNEALLRWQTKSSKRWDIRTQRKEIVYFDIRRVERPNGSQNERRQTEERSLCRRQQHSNIQEKCSSNSGASGKWIAEYLERSYSGTKVDLKLFLANAQATFVQCFSRVCRLNDITRATNAKSEVEQKQRDEAKDRKSIMGEWETKVNISQKYISITYNISSFFIYI